MATVEERKARSTKVFIKEEGGNPDPFFIGVNEWSEEHLHEGHNTEHLETLADNAAEVTIWYYCQDCKTEYWHSSSELVEKEEVT